MFTIAQKSKSYSAIKAEDDIIHILVGEFSGRGIAEIEITSGKTKLSNFDIFSVIETLFSALDDEQKKNMLEFLKYKRW